MRERTFLSVGLLVAALVVARPLYADSPMAAGAKVFCTKIQPLLQPSVKVTLVLFGADDQTNDEFHAGELQYKHCQFRQADGSMIDIGLHDDADGTFDDAAKNGYAALTGYADKGRYTVRGSAGQKWLDLVRGKVACEARFALDDDGSPLNQDWKEVGAKICTAAFGLK